ncbi:MAG: BC1881 family protein [Ruminococcus sp.]|nr:BC1881 family protein [Ruminococcus sp.]
MNGLKEIPTYQLVEELKNREAVKTIIVEPYEDFTVNVNGSAVVLIVTD